MSDIDELAKLAALKKDGVVSEDEFNAKKAEILGAKKTEPKKSKGLLWKVPVSLIGIVALLATWGVFETGLKCDSSSSKKALKSAFDQSQFARTLNLSAVDITDVTEKSRNDTAGELMCHATVTMNTAKQVPVEYKIQVHKDGRFLIVFQVVDQPVGSNLPAAASLSQPTVQPKPAQSALPQATIDSCVDKRIAAFRKEAGPDAPIKMDVLDEWTEECKKEISG